MTPAEFVIQAIDDKIGNLLTESFFKTHDASLHALSADQMAAFFCEAEQIMNALRTLLQVTDLVHCHPANETRNVHVPRSKSKVCQFCINGGEDDQLAANASNS